MRAAHPTCVHLDVAKLVDAASAASAPVALIIATSIFLPNLGAKYALLAGVFRDLLREYRQTEEKDKGSLRAQSVYKALEMYAHRLHVLIRATFWLTISILCFILTVVFTGVSVIVPRNGIWPAFTAAFSFAGLLILAASVGFEIWENHQAKRALIFETSELPGILPKELRQLKRSFLDRHARSDRHAS